MTSEEIYKLTEENGENSANIIEYSQKLAESIENALKNKASSENLKTEINKQNAKNTSQDKDIQNLYNTMAKAKLQGTSFHITNSAEAPMKISPRGNIEQDNREGYNKLKNTATSQTVSGVTFTVNKDGTVVGNGTATENIIFKIMENFELEDETIYTLLGAGSGSSSTTYGLLINQYYDSASHIESDYGNGVQFTYKIASKSTNSIYIYIHSGVTISNVVFKPMLLKGEYTISTAPTYEQYGAMPSLAFPSPVKHVGGSVKSYNIIDLSNYITSTVGGVTVSQNEDRSFNAIGTGTANYINFRANENITDLLEDRETYTLWANQHSPLFYIQVQAVKTDGTSIYYVTQTSNMPIVVDKTNVQYYNLKIQSGASSNGATYDLSNVKFMLYKGTENKPYLPYGELGSVYDIAKVNKNICGELEIGGYNTTTGIAEDNTNLYRTKEPILVDNSKTIYISKNGVALFVRIFFYDENKNFLSTTTGTNFSCPSNAKYINMQVGLDNAGNSTEGIQIEYDAVTAYTAHQQQNHSFDLTNLPLYSENDYIYKSGDKWFVHNEFEKVTADEISIKEIITTNISGKSRFAINTTKGQAFANADSSNAKNTIFSNIAKCVSRVNTFENVNGIAETESSYYYGTLGVLYSDEIASMTAGQALQYLKDNNACFIYKLATPTETEITDETVIEVCEALLNGYACDEVTNITVDNPILSAPLILDVEYYIKTALGLETKVSYEEYAKLLKRVEELEAQIGG